MEKNTYQNPGPSVEDTKNTKGFVALEFGTDWCGFCRSSAPFIEPVLAENKQFTHVKVEDGSGRRLGRTYKVKLWPTVIFMKDGNEVSRVVRPQNVQEVTSAINTALQSNL